MRREADGNSGGHPDVLPDQTREAVWDSAEGQQQRGAAEFKGLHWFPVDESYKVTARLEAFPEPKEIQVPNVLGGNFKMKSPGPLKFTLKGKECSLEPMLAEDGTKAENPPCAFTPYATCPLPPPGNKLEVEIAVGEKRYDH